MKKFLTRLAHFLVVRDIGVNWANRQSIVPCSELSEVSTELMTLFTRRRELMYQIGVLVAVGTGLIQINESQGQFAHFGLSASTLLAIFLTAGCILFSLRFIQIHLGIVYHGVEYAFIESHLLKLNSTDHKKSIAGACKLNKMGVSFLIIIFFAVLSSFCALLACQQSSLPSWARGLIAVAILFSLIFRVLRGHWIVAENAKENAAKHQRPNGTETELREHYLASLAATHSDMICVTAIATAQTIATFTIIGWLDEHESERGNVSYFAPTFFALFSFVLGVIAVKIYQRLDLAIQKFCPLLDLPTKVLYPLSMSDVGIGYFVTACLASFNIMVLLSLMISILTEKTQIASIIAFDRISQEWTCFCGGILLLLFFMISRHFYLKKHYSNTSPPEETPTEQS